jgi:predicted CopG family antitoxin
MTSTTTLQVPISLMARLGAMKSHPRESYADVIERLLEDAQELGPNTQRAVNRTRRYVKAGKFKAIRQVKREMGL